MSEAASAESPSGGLDRRQLVCGAAGFALVAAALAACSSGDDGDGSSSQGKVTASPGTPIAQTTEVPVGGGVVLTLPDGAKVVVVQPTQGDFQAFSAVCTHQGTTINPPQGELMTCPNHGSQFRAEDGSVARGPAARPLPAVNITVQGTNILVA